jgi:hypothetical protein
MKTVKLDALAYMHLLHTVLCLTIQQVKREILHGEWKILIFAHLFQVMAFCHLLYLNSIKGLYAMEVKRKVRGNLPRKTVVLISKINSRNYVAQWKKRRVKMNMIRFKSIRGIVIAYLTDYFRIPKKNSDV